MLYKGMPSLLLIASLLCGNACLTSDNLAAQECCDTVACCDADPCCDSFGCDSGCDACGCDSSGCLCGGFLSGLKSRLRQSDHCFDDFISPMIDFVHFEDPRNLTELRPIFMTHQFPSTLGPANIPAGGSAQLFALQFRIALTERLSLIAVKDGYVIDNSEGALDGLLASGWADVTAGLKYNLIRDTKAGRLVSGGFTYEIPMGNKGTLQALGDGEFNVFASAGQRLLDGDAHYMTSVGYQFPVDGAIQTSSIHWLNHLDYRLTDRLYLLTENSWWHWLDDAENGAPLGVAGQDILNLPASNVAGNDLVTHNVGLKLKPNRNLEAGVAYEFPLTDFKDIIQDRVQLDLIIRY
ncbi:hypothetical protein [Stieleria varia]|uniref:Uncharacterized protein n=1 Tax=Stieleria varia TaxID=2528005 RepID=A0A5C6B9Y5_9BACT|nr:hypothetical protein [Stieleria varia]TWU08442.1 hypothetical protein Pla52n_10250 [Stieleria varia]